MGIYVDVRHENSPAARLKRAPGWSRRGPAKNRMGLLSHERTITV